ncbi:M48 family metalloprotease, partial [Candidatus Aerophobetes bacterium]|nr:M48 family metalloprotease [Candidatus Aerophobetes bacterium]
LIFLGYGRQDEFEADNLGTRYAYDAGYDARAMKDFLSKLKELEGREPSSIEMLLRSHPPTSERIQRVEAQIQAFPTLSGKQMYEERFLAKVKGAPLLKAPSTEESVEIDKEKIILLLRAYQEGIAKQMEMINQAREKLEFLKQRIDELEKKLTTPDDTE